MRAVCALDMCVANESPVNSPRQVVNDKSEASGFTAHAQMYHNRVQQHFDCVYSPDDILCVKQHTFDGFCL